MDESAAQAGCLEGARRAHAGRRLRGGEGVRFSQTIAERMEAVARIVLRRQRSSVRVSEEEAAYSAG